MSIFRHSLKNFFRKPKEKVIYEVFIAPSRTESIYFFKMLLHLTSLIA